jgi:hypothetical protein
LILPGQHHDSTSAHDATLGLDQLSERIDALIAAWDSATEPPALAEFLPAGPPLLRRLAMIELIKVDLEYRCQQPEHTKRIEQYLDEFPELGTSGAVPCELIYEEYHLRKLSGQQVDAREYFDRFPKQAAELGRLLGLESPHLSTSIGSNTKFEEIEVGHKIDDFDLLTRLGRGAFATVFLARQQSMQRIVALRSRPIAATSRRRWRYWTIPTSFASSISGNCLSESCGCCTCSTCRAERCKPSAMASDSCRRRCEPGSACST